MTMGSCMTNLDSSLFPNLLHAFSALVQSLLRSFSPLASCEQDSKLMELKDQKIRGCSAYLYGVFIFRFRGEHCNGNAFVRIWYNFGYGQRPVRYAEGWKCRRHIMQADGSTEVVTMRIIRRRGVSCRRKDTRTWYLRIEEVIHICHIMSSSLFILRSREADPISH